ncbi:MerR family transcriptional regulator [Lutibacter sp. HS1-25]|uniref:chaperone modulator CbpM n=1 Tax=Lutibacter sp. HS1-25 TaxID=2485000 RepID=UPI0010111188|nr:chaperone modulator CbpM [Lutibacter sp. HS1-25]RXP59486.1 MerR family transcriptional regulator [Lutibacter sp. HS1-25]
MDATNYISLTQLCEHYQVEFSFFNQLHEVGLIKVTTIKQTLYLHQDTLNDLEKMIRIHQDLNINIEGIDAVFNLLQKMENLQRELNSLQNRLKLYEKN